MNQSERLQRLEHRVNALEYEAHLKSEKWKSLRKECFRRAGYRCEFCGEVARLAAHHVRYPKNGFKRDSVENLVAACSKCHGICHGILTFRRVEPDLAMRKARIVASYPHGRRRDLMLSLVEAEENGDREGKRKALVGLQETINA